MIDTAQMADDAFVSSFDMEDERGPQEMLAYVAVYCTVVFSVLAVFL